MSAVLREFAEAVGVGPKRQIVLVLDGAGWHRARQLVVPEGIHLVFQPAYSPELQPAEKLWPLLNEVVANRSFRDLAELKVVVSNRCAQLSEQPDIVRRRAHFHWWPSDHLLPSRSI